MRACSLVHQVLGADNRISWMNFHYLPGYQAFNKMRSEAKGSMPTLLLKRMLRPSSRIFALIPFFCLLAATSKAATLTPCAEGARTSLPCELTFPMQSGDLSPFRDLLLSVEFRSPSASTVRVIGFASEGKLHVRFTPTEPGAWTYRTTSPLPALDGKEATFNAADSGMPGMLTVANLRHWRTGKRQPHLWLSAAAPFLEIAQPQFKSWLDERKHEGFTHVRGTLLATQATLQPLDGNGEPNEEYFSALDDRLLEAANRGFVLDLIVADASGKIPLTEPLVRFLVARYGSLNVSWQGIEQFDTRPGVREQLRALGEQLKKFDGYSHPRSSDAEVSTSPLLNDGWMDFLIEASGHPEVGAVEHQFTRQPQIHVINSEEPAAFRRELWSATTSGESPSVSYAALQKPENRKAIATWKNILANTRYWEFEPYFDVSGATAAGLEEIEYLAYAPSGGIIELTIPKHKYNPQWVNPETGEEIPLKDFKGETFSQPTPDGAHDWILEFAREGKKESMAKYFYFESVDAPVQEVESEPPRVPFKIAAPEGDEFSGLVPVPFEATITRANRASRFMQYLWWGNVVAGGEGARLLGIGSSGSLAVPPFLIKNSSANLTVRVEAINAYGKAFEVDRVYRLTQ